MRKRYRDLGFTVGKLPTGNKNCITDVPGVAVGHKTLQYKIDEENSACTGVTAILPHQGNVFQHKVVAASYILNGFGKSTGLIQLNELGRLESPIMLTNTFGVPQAAQGALEYLLDHNDDIGDSTGTANVVVGECNDSYLNAIRHFPVQSHHAREAITSATTNQVEEGAVGAGAGMICCEFKGGIGTSSRVVNTDEETYTLGCLVLSNFGKKEDLLYYQQGMQDSGVTDDVHHPPQSDGSIMIVVATNAPVNERQLQRISKRCGIGLGRAGSHMANGSGDIVIAFSNAAPLPHYQTSAFEKTTQLRDDHRIMTDLFTAAAEATNEAIMNSLTMAETTTGHKNRKVEALPYELLNKK